MIVPAICLKIEHGYYPKKKIVFRLKR